MSSIHILSSFSAPIHADPSTAFSDTHPGHAHKLLMILSLKNVNHRHDRSCRERFESSYSDMLCFQRTTYNFSDSVFTLVLTFLILTSFPARPSLSLRRRAIVTNHEQHFSLRRRRCSSSIPVPKTSRNSGDDGHP
jgi:rRNA maturation protein Rpf1